MNNGLKEKLQNIGCVAGGYLAYRKAAIPVAKTSRMLQARYGWDSNKPSKELSDEFISAFNEVRKAYPSYDKTLVFADFSDKKAMLSSFKDELLGILKEREKLIAWVPESKAKEFYRKYLSQMDKSKIKKIKAYYRTVRDGKNAFYNFKRNQIDINMQLRPGAVFHEFGHHIDYLHVPKFLAYLGGFLRHNKVKGISYWAILLTAMLTPEQKKGVKGAKPDKAVDKSKEIHPFRKFVKNNCALLAAGISVPYVLEELNASRIGQKIGSKFIKTPQAKRLLARTHIGSALSYITTPVIAGTSMYFANLFRDKVLADKILKNN